MVRNKMAIEDLARITANGFASMDKRFEAIETTMATKVELQEVREDLRKTKEELQKDIAHIQRFPASLGRRVDHVEDDIRLIKTKVGLR